MSTAEVTNKHYDLPCVRFHLWHYPPCLQTEFIEVCDWYQRRCPNSLRNQLSSNDLARWLKFETWDALSKVSCLVKN